MALNRARHLRSQIGSSDDQASRGKKFRIFEHPLILTITDCYHCFAASMTTATSPMTRAPA